MMIGLFITGFLLLITFTLTFSESNDPLSIIALCLTSGLFAIILFVVIDREDSKTIPSAIDVYRNKTTLQITYKDSIAIDSVVVFKDK